MPLNILIAGVGLIGGSLGLALKGSSSVNKIIGVDSDLEALKKAEELGAIDCYTSLSEGAKQADIIILCTPVNTFASIIDEIMDLLRPGTIITDTGSTKEKAMNTFAKLPDYVYVIGGHPMAGGEAIGIINADKYLFENAVYVLTPAANTPSDIINQLKAVLSVIGARFMIMEPRYHDEIVAVISHIPHLLSAALVNLTNADRDKLSMAAGGFRDTTRIASSNPKLWQQILFSNRESVIKYLDQLIISLNEYRDMLDNHDEQQLFEQLKRAQETRNSIPYMRKGLMPGFSDIICIVPDRPGIIGELGNILGEKHINIVDLEILHVREGDGGTIRIGVPTYENACQAVDELKEHGIKAWRR
ncbi:MAG: prephenate dehydrogenase [Syntrophomonadaceae bacterium]|jgi:prephenate dehydrogenase|nr:prephenate dehydrogenase [Syntrophomonadaceae bacterium]